MVHLLMKVDWSYTTTTLGVQCVIVDGISEMLMWSVECLDILLHFNTEHQLTMEKEVVQCGCLVSLVQEERIT